MKEEQKGRLEAVWEKLFAYKEESKDPQFTQYLVLFQQKLVAKQHEIDMLGEELEQKHALYLKRQEEQATSEELPLTQEMAATDTDTYEAPKVSEIPQKKKEKNGEFLLGTYAFSMVGVFFLLVSAGMLASYLMNDIFQGIFLFVVATVVYAIGEFVLRKKSRPFHLVVSGLGVAAWYIVAYVNCEGLLGYHYFAAILMVAVFGIAVILVDRWRSGKEWDFRGLSAGAYYFGIATLWAITLVECDYVGQAIALSVLLLISSILSMRYRFLRGGDVGLLIWSAVLMIGNYEDTAGYIMFAVLLVKVVFVRFYHLFYELFITLVTVLFVAMSFENDITIAISVAMVWLFMLLFNYVKCFQSYYTKTYNYIMWILLVLIYLVFALDAESMGWLIGFIMAFLGTGILFTTISERFGIKEKYRPVICAGFMTYMALVVPFTYDVTASIILMLIGVVSIGTGFYIKDKVLRIYGLVASLTVCFKITLFDFADGESLQRMILFFVAGAISLIISGIYVLLEKTVKNNSGE